MNVEDGAISRERRDTAPRPVRHAATLIVVGAVLALAGLGAAHVLLARQLRVPIIYGDELGYLENARFLASGGQRPALTYYPGMSLALVPAWLLTSHSLTVWRAAQDVNAVAAVVTAIEAVILGAQCGLGRSARWLVAGAAAAYPAVMLYSDVALAESLFQMLFLGLVLAVVAARRSPSPATWGCIGGLAAALTLVHPRGIAAAVATGVVTLLVLRPIRERAIPLLSLVAGGLLGSGVIELLLRSTRAMNVVTRSDYAAGAVVGRALTTHDLGSVALDVAGRLFYLTLATGGLAPLALVAGAAGLVALVRREDGQEQVASAMTALSAAGMLGLSVLLVGTGNRPDQLVHGRHLDGVVAPILVVALARVITGGRRWVLIWLGAGSGMLAASGGVLAASGHSGSAPINPVNVLGIEPLLRRLADDQLHIGPLVAVGVAGITVLALIAARRPRTSVVVLAAVFVGLAVDTQRNYFVAGSAAKSRQTVLVTAIQAATRRLGVPAACVSYDGDFDFNYFADRLLLGTQPIREIATAQQACGPFVITARPDFEHRFPGAKLVLDEDDVDEDLYVLAGPAQATLQAAGWLLPNVTPGPLPITGQRATIITPPRQAVVVHTGSSTALHVKVTNASNISPWPAELALKQGEFAVRVAVRWFPAGAQPSSPGEPGNPLATATAELPRSLVPGSSTAVKLPLIARDSQGRPLPPAEYVVRVAVYQELHGSFAGAVNLRVRVTG